MAIKLINLVQSRPSATDAAMKAQSFLIEAIDMMVIAGRALERDAEETQ